MRSITIDIEAATTPALDLATLKKDLRISEPDLDSVIVRQYIPAAVAWAEAFTKRTLISRLHSWIISDFPTGWNVLYLPRGVVSAVASVQYTSSGVVTTLTGPTSGSPAGTGYQEDLTGHRARIMPAVGDSWPSVDRDVVQPVKITYTAGYASEALVPTDIKRAMTAQVYGAMELDGLLTIRPGFDIDFAEKLLSPYRSTEA